MPSTLQNFPIERLRFHFAHKYPRVEGQGEVQEAGLFGGRRQQRQREGGAAGGMAKSLKVSHKRICMRN